MKAFTKHCRFYSYAIISSLLIIIRASYIFMHILYATPLGFLVCFYRDDSPPPLLNSLFLLSCPFPICLQWRRTGAPSFFLSLRFTQTQLVPSFLLTKLNFPQHWTCFVSSFVGAAIVVESLSPGLLLYLLSWGYTLAWVKWKDIYAFYAHND